MEINRSKGVKAENRAHKLKSGVNWQEELKQKGVKQADVKQGSQGTTAVPLNLPKRSHDQRLKQHIDVYLMHDSCKRRTLNESYVFKGFTHITFTAALRSVLFTAQSLRTKGSRMITMYTVKANSSNSASEMWSSVLIFERETHRPTFFHLSERPYRVLLGLADTAASRVKQSNARHSN